jgi:hypothetical protein
VMVSGVFLSELIDNRDAWSSASAPLVMRDMVVRSRPQGRHFYGCLVYILEAESKSRRKSMFASRPDPVLHELIRSSSCRFARVWLHPLFQTIMPVSLTVIQTDGKPEQKFPNDRLITRP